MSPNLRVVIDTNVLISRLLAPQSVPGQAVSHAVREGQLLASNATLEEIAEVLGRSRFDNYLSPQERSQFLRLLHRIVETPPITHQFRDCADADDNKFLDLAVSGRASVIIAGDKDLLLLHPFHDIPILKPASYLNKFARP